MELVVVEGVQIREEREGGEGWRGRRGSKTGTCFTGVGSGAVRHAPVSWPRHSAGARTATGGRSAISFSSSAFSARIARGVGPADGRLKLPSATECVRSWLGSRRGLRAVTDSHQRVTFFEGRHTAVEN